MGIKGVGQAGTIPAAPAVINSICDALTPFSITDMPMPATPERDWRISNEASVATR